MDDEWGTVAQTSKVDNSNKFFHPIGDKKVDSLCILESIWRRQHLKTFDEGGLSQAPLPKGGLSPPLRHPSKGYLKGRRLKGGFEVGLKGGLKPPVSPP